mgnify:CR=1 FL=1|jgi:hypothetical protein
MGESARRVRLRTGGRGKGSPVAVSVRRENFFHKKVNERLLSFGPGGISVFEELHKLLRHRLQVLDNIPHHRVPSSRSTNEVR